jgi:hypothetical protein
MATITQVIYLGGTPDFENGKKQVRQRLLSPENYNGQILPSFFLIKRRSIYIRLKKETNRLT